MNGHAIPINTNVFLELIDALKTKGLSPLRKKLLLTIPDNAFRYGSDLWWEQSDLKAQEDIKQGNVIKFQDAKEMIAYLHLRTIGPHDAGLGKN